jgi:hypothetical protein
MGPWQGDSFIRPLFTLVHFHALRYSLGVFPLCFFLSLTNNTHIFGIAQVVSFAFDHVDY